MPKTILIICRANLSKAPRFMMQIKALKSAYHLIAAGIRVEKINEDYQFIALKNTESKIPNISFHLKSPFLIRKFVSAFIRLIYIRKLNNSASNKKIDFKVLNKLNFDLVIVHHFSDLELGSKLAKAKRTKLIFNAHEYYPLEFDDRKEWMNMEFPYLMNLGKKYLSNVALCFCVGQKIADKYKLEFNLKSVVVPNAKEFYDLSPRSLNAGDTIKLIHHGAAIRERKIELMLDMMKLLGEKYSLDLILLPAQPNYYDELKETYKNCLNINFIAPVAVSEIPVFTNKYDIGLFLLPPNNFNYKYALPNKLFEFIQARLALAIGPSVEMAEIVKKYDLGVVSADFSTSSLAKKILELTPEKIMYHKNQCDKFAHELSSEKVMLLIKKSVDDLLAA